MKKVLPEDNELSKGSVSRRTLLLAAAATSASSLLSAQMPQGAPRPAAGAPPAGGRALTPGGNGPIKVLFITKFHPFDREGLFSTLDSMGKDITWTHIEHPAAEAFYDPKLAADYDVFLFYDAFAGRTQKTNPDGTVINVDLPPTPKMRSDLKQLLQNGDKGFVFLHHAIASWVHSWPAGVNGSNEYVEVMGAAADWGTPIKNIRGKDYPISGYKGNTPQHITIVDRDHPTMAGVTDFDIVDEAYLCPMFEDSVHCLMRTDFKPVAEAFGPRVAGHPPGSNMTAWVKTAERSPVFYIQHGHSASAWQNPAWPKIVLNAIKWTNSKEAKDWAHANPKKIFV